MILVELQFYVKTNRSTLLERNTITKPRMKHQKDKNTKSPRGTRNYGTT